MRGKGRARLAGPRAARRDLCGGPRRPRLFLVSRRADARAAPYTSDIYKERLENQGKTKQTKKSRRESSRSGRDGEGRPRPVPRGHALGQRRVAFVRWQGGRAVASGSGFDRTSSGGRVLARLRNFARRELPSVSRRRRPGRHRRRERRAERPPGAPRPSLRRLGVARRALVEGQAQQRRVLGASPHELEKRLLAELRDRGPALGYELCGNQPAS